MAFLAHRALGASMPEVLERPLGFLSVIEEECTGTARCQVCSMASAAAL
jgi:hypothetical protein